MCSHEPLRRSAVPAGYRRKQGPMLGSRRAQLAGLREVAQVVKTSLVSQPGNQARQAPVPASAHKHQVKLAIGVKVASDVTSRGRLLDHLNQILKRGKYIAEVVLGSQPDRGNLEQVTEPDDLGSIRGAQGDWPVPAVGYDLHQALINESEHRLAHRAVRDA